MSKGRWGDKDDPESLAQLGEGRVLGDEPRPRPRGVGARFEQRPFEEVEVRVCAVSGPVCASDHRIPQRHRLVGLPDEERVTFGLSEQRDRVDPRAAFSVELAYGVDEAQRGFAPG